MKTDVLILLGSANDEKYLENCVSFLKQMGVPYSVRVASAHRSPDRVIEILKELWDYSLIITFAGHAAHLAGVAASHSAKPVISVPLPTSDLQGLDSLLSSVQMPGGVPVATMSIGEAGSYNAACLAVQILSLHNPALNEKWLAFKSNLAKKTELSSTEVEKKWQSS